MSFLIDQAARDIALNRWALPECLHIPVAVVDEAAIRSYIGDIDRVLAGGSPAKAFLVNAKEQPPVDERLPIWRLASSKIFFLRRQVWVHVAFTRYRDAYRKAFPRENIGGKVLSHAMNRRRAAQKGFGYVRITPTSRGCNSSSAFSENWGITMQAANQEVATNPTRDAFIQYADLCDLMVMLDVKIGGGVMAIVNEGQKLVRPAISEDLG